MSRRNSIADRSRVHVRLFSTIGAGRRVVEIDEALELAADPLGPVRDCVERRSGCARRCRWDRRSCRWRRRPARSAGGRRVGSAAASAAAQVAGMQARRGRVEAGVDRDRSGGQLVAPARRGRWTVRSARASPTRRGCSTFPWSRSSRTSRCAPGAGARGLRRYSETSGRPASQSRHGRSAAWLMPTRGPSTARRSSASLSCTGLFASKRSIPLSSMVIPRAEHRFPGPRASAVGRTGAPRRAPAMSRPDSTAAARSSTAPATPS